LKSTTNSKSNSITHSRPKGTFRIAGVPHSEPWSLSGESESTVARAQRRSHSTNRHPPNTSLTIVCRSFRQAFAESLLQPASANSGSRDRGKRDGSRDEPFQFHPSRYRASPPLSNGLQALARALAWAGQPVQHDPARGTSCGRDTWPSSRRQATADQPPCPARGPLGCFQRIGLIFPPAS